METEGIGDERTAFYMQTSRDFNVLYHNDIAIEKRFAGRLEMHMLSEYYMHEYGGSYANNLGYSRFLAL